MRKEGGAVALATIKNSDQLETKLHRQWYSNHSEESRGNLEQRQSKATLQNLVTPTITSLELQKIEALMLSTTRQYT